MLACSNMLHPPLHVFRKRACCGKAACGVEDSAAVLTDISIRRGQEWQPLQQSGQASTGYQHKGGTRAPESCGEFKSAYRYCSLWGRCQT